MPFFKWAAALAAVLLFGATPAHAQAVCGDRGEIIARLESGYQEQATAIGLASNGGVVELYVSESGSWTLLLTQTTGVSCLIAAGEHWETVPPVVKERTAL